MSQNDSYSHDFEDEQENSNWVLNAGLYGPDCVNKWMIDTAANNGALETMKYVDDALFNLSTSYLDTGFRTRQLLSDYYVENASFLKMDNLTINYNFGKIKDIVGLNLSFMIQNVFTITRYSGIDPEIYLGVDQNFYPRPRIYSLGIGLTF